MIYDACTNRNHFWKIIAHFLADFLSLFCQSGDLYLGDGCHLVKPTVILKLEKTRRKMKWDKSLIWKSWFDRYELQLVSLVVLDMDNIPIFAVSVMCPMHNNGFHSNFNLGSNYTTNKLIVSVLKTQLAIAKNCAHASVTNRSWRALEHVLTFDHKLLLFLGSGRGRRVGASRASKLPVCSNWCVHAPNNNQCQPLIIVRCSWFENTKAGSVLN